MNEFIFIAIAFILIFIIVYRKNSGENVYKYISRNVGLIYEKFAPYSFKMVREKVKELGQEYTPRQYAVQIIAFSVGAAVVSYLYFYNLVWCIVYIAVAVAIIPYLAYLRCKRLYSEFIFEQIQVYTTNTIMEFATTQSFVKALEGVYESGVLEDPVRSDVKMMIDLAYKNGTITESVDYMNSRYDYYIVRNMHQLFTQITNEGARDASGSLENMSLDIDMLVEGVYRDRIDRATFHKKFLQFGVVLYLMIMLVQFLLGTETYLEMLKIWYVQLLLHGIIIINTYFILNGEKFYNENVGAE
ncbi:MAG: hypothetical protein SOT41_04195 [Candidatus Faecisoma sp.]|nr:hypothetical protein [Acholeplasma sp.]MCI5677707.1 hypothetical protein [Acholeplasma sp.]MDY2892960.1 hypothetical protein [Candidatus Faecisoma sp.]CCY28748.1 putative uncharacterized protein [Acholeplasma sp. CAG:878]